MIVHATLDIRSTRALAFRNHAPVTGGFNAKSRKTSGKGILGCAVHSAAPSPGDTCNRSRWREAAPAAGHPLSRAGRSRQDAGGKASNETAKLTAALLISLRLSRTYR